MTTTIKLQWRYIDPPPMTGALADLKQWVADAGTPELEAKFRELLGLVRRNGISDELVYSMSTELDALVKLRQREEFEACKRAERDGEDLERWLHGEIYNGDS
ncbi:TPA: hypothetical protein ACKFMW_002403 [Enterobacter hormaechei]|uniref:hypothetical protein n=1 Tax=Enterobacteriaceae TaxID=543 RepID=UPI000B60C9F6|nr:MULTISPECIES: hypothetical protein [Enterobacteriaceae]PQZ06765.1 hypothetical protein C5960_11505 [Cronobacter sakazakii]PQZ32658.1 hypothetical protein C5971_12795 [Cronobacter sakazakii]SAZ19683.1 conserved protein of unknown function [Citrobacter amalonaticus]